MVRLPETVYVAVSLQVVDQNVERGRAPPLIAHLDHVPELLRRHRQVAIFFQHRPEQALCREAPMEDPLSCTCLACLASG